MVVERVKYSELLASLSHALDLVEGQPAGHAVRTCLIAVRTGKELGMSEADQSRLYFASLLKDTGCSNNSARIHKIFGGDEILCKKEVKFVDWSDPVASLKFGLKYTEHGGTVGQKLRRLAQNLAPPRQVMADVTAARCNRGAQIAHDLGFDPEISTAIAQIDEHWDGNGAPLGLKGDDISSLARIVCMSQTLEIFATAYGVDSAYTMLAQRIGRWFDPEIAAAAMSFRTDEPFWAVHKDSAHGAAGQMELPEVDHMADDAEIDQVCRAYASIIDAKSTFTGEHSSRVTSYAVAIAEAMGIDGERLATLKRAALLHDIGKLGVSNCILDKPGKLSEDEFDQIKLHPYFTYEILKLIPGFERLAEIAANHHERLDGRGYWRGLAADDLDVEMRCLTAADIFDALSANRPYREALPLDEVFAIMDRDAGTGIDPECIDTLKSLYRDEQHLAA